VGLAHPSFSYATPLPLLREGGSVFAGCCPNQDTFEQFIQTSFAHKPLRIPMKVLLEHALGLSRKVSAQEKKDLGNSSTST
jgi:hypothetical protein